MTKQHVAKTETKVVDDPESVQLQHTNGFRVDDHILIQEPVTAGTEFHHTAGLAPNKLSRAAAARSVFRLMKVTSIQDIRGKTKCATIEGVYYFFRHEIPKRFVSQMPSQDPRYGPDQEVFRSSFTCTKRADQFVKVCQVIDGDTSPSTLLRKAKLARSTMSSQHALSSPALYFCRSRFKPVHRKVVFSPLTVLQNTEYVRNVELENLFPTLPARVDAVKYQCHERELLVNNSSQDSSQDTRDHPRSIVDLYSHRNPRTGLDREDRITRPFLSLVACLNLALGNVVRVWHRKRHVLGQILMISPSGLVSVQLSDGKILNHVKRQQLLCLVAEDEALGVLSEVQYQGPLALVKCAQILVMKQNQWLFEFRKECHKSKFHFSTLVALEEKGGGGSGGAMKKAKKSTSSRVTKHQEEGEEDDENGEEEGGKEEENEDESRPQDLDDEDEEEEEDAKHNPPSVAQYQSEMHFRMAMVRNSRVRKRRDVSSRLTPDKRPRGRPVASK